MDGNPRTVFQKGGKLEKTNQSDSNHTGKRSYNKAGVSTPKTKSKIGINGKIKINISDKQIVT